MATIKQTIYRCDACGSEVAQAKDLKKVYVQWGRRVYTNYQSDRPGIKADFCPKCLESLAVAIEPFYGSRGKAELLGEAEAEEV